jgi:YegS/Rv2252/BmrU family lipid kinase
MPESGSAGFLTAATAPDEMTVGNAHPRNRLGIGPDAVGPGTRKPPTVTGRMKRKFIVNPHSGKGTTARALAELKAFFIRKTGEFDCSLAENRAAAIRLTRDCLRQGVDQVIAVGGDGTVNAVVNGFFAGGGPIRPRPALVVASAGTGGDYFKTIVAGSKTRDWREIVLQHSVRSVDVGRIKYADPDLPDQYFVNMASVGMIADVVAKKNRSPRWMPPKLRYVLPAVSSFFCCPPRQVRVTADGASRDVELLAISVCKGIYAGGGMRFGGEVTLFDGLFDVTIFRAMKPVEMLLKMRKLYTGSFQDEPAVEKLKARTISCNSPAPMPVEFDGDVCGATALDASVEPGAIRICFPRG